MAVLDEHPVFSFLKKKKDMTFGQVTKDTSLHQLHTTKNLQKLSICVQFKVQEGKAALHEQAAPQFCNRTMAFFFS